MSVLLTGNSPRLANQGELLNRQNLGRSYYVVSDFLEGDLLDMSNLEYRSPHTGIDKTNIKEYISRPLKIRIMALKMKVILCPYVTSSRGSTYAPMYICICVCTAGP